jgi:hypothetical protein
MEFSMIIEIAIRRRSGKVVLVPAGSRTVPGVVLGAMIDGSYHGEDVKAVRAALVDDSVSEWQLLRERLGLSPTEFAKAIGCTVAAVCTWERRGTDPRSDIRERILTLT